MKKQVYEDYWKFTMAYTNIYGDKFKESLRIIVDFINIFPNINFPRFNFADMYITIGWVVLAFIFALYTHKEIVKNKRNKE